MNNIQDQYKNIFLMYFSSLPILLGKEEYIDDAIRFAIELNPNIADRNIVKQISNDFIYWISFVDYDVSDLTYNEFINIINKTKLNGLSNTPSKIVNLNKEKYYKRTFESYLNDYEIPYESLKNEKQIAQHVNRCYSTYLNDSYNTYELNLKPLLYEGLITSYNPDKFAQYLYDNNEKILECYVDERNHINITTSIYDKNTIKEYINSLLNVYGYYISREGNDIKHKDWYFFILEAKYDINCTDYIYNDLNGIVYHITKEKYLDKILKVGLIPKSYNNGSNYPERIYVANMRNVKETENLGNILNKRSNSTDKRCLLKIDLKLHYNYKKFGTYINFYLDPNVVGDNGFYTLECIPPTCLSVIKIFNTI